MFFSRLKKWRPLNSANAAEPKRHIKKLFATTTTQIFFPSTNSDQLSGRGPTKKKLSRTLTLIHPHPRPVENDHPEV